MLSERRTGLIEPAIKTEACSHHSFHSFSPSVGFCSIEFTISHTPAISSASFSDDSKLAKLVPSKI